MDLRQLSFVVAVVDHGGFTRAAAALHVAQPSLSQGIRTLEAELGVDLFDRVGRGVTLTAAGRALLPAARQALHDVEIARAAVDAVRGVAGGRLDLVSIPTLGVSPVGEYIGAFRRLHPDVTVRLVEPDDSSAIANQILGGESEIGFTELPVGGTAVADGRLVATELDEQEYVAVHHRSVERGSLVSLAQLAELPLVTTTPGTSTRRLVDEAFRQAGCEPNVAIETDLREVITAIVGAGGGYTIMPRTVADRMVAAGDVRVAEILPRISRRVGVICRAGELSPAGAAFLALVTQSGGERPVVA
ncbi:MAG: LysR substrate-binding domain-containing protein [Acidimicrobiales bacterium]